MIRICLCMVVRSAFCPIEGAGSVTQLPHNLYIISIIPSAKAGFKGIPVLIRITGLSIRFCIYINRHLSSLRAKPNQSAEKESVRGIMENNMETSTL